MDKLHIALLRLSKLATNTAIASSELSHLVIPHLDSLDFDTRANLFKKVVESQSSPILKDFLNK